MGEISVPDQSVRTERRSISETRNGHSSLICAAPQQTPEVFGEAAAVSHTSPTRPSCPRVVLYFLHKPRFMTRSGSTPCVSHGARPRTK